MALHTKNIRNILSYIPISYTYILSYAFWKRWLLPGWLTLWTAEREGRSFSSYQHLHQLDSLPGLSYSRRLSDSSSISQFSTHLSIVHNQSNLSSICMHIQAHSGFLTQNIHSIVSNILTWSMNNEVHSKSTQFWKPFLHLFWPHPQLHQIFLFKLNFDYSLFLMKRPFMKFSILFDFRSWLQHQSGCTASCRPPRH